MTLTTLLILGFIGLCIMTAVEAAKENQELVKFYEKEEETK